LNEWLEQRGFNAYTETRLGREMREALGFEDAQRGDKKWRAWIGIQWADASYSHSSQGSHPFETRIKKTKSRFENPCEPCEPCDSPLQSQTAGANDAVPSDTTCAGQPSTTPLGIAVRAIEAVLGGGKRMSRLELYRATGLPPTVFREAFEHMVATGELVADKGEYILPTQKASTGGADATTSTSANENTEQCLSEDSPPNTTPLGIAVRAIEVALAGGKQMRKQELQRATGLPSSVFEAAVQHLLNTNELIAEAGVYQLQEVDGD